MNRREIQIERLKELVSLLDLNIDDAAFEALYMLVEQGVPNRTIINVLNMMKDKKVSSVSSDVQVPWSNSSSKLL